MTFITAGAALGSAAAISIAGGGAAMGLTAGAIGMVGSVIGGGLTAGLIGAGLGAATSAISGGDVGQGALWGGIGGALTGGVGGALAGPGASAVAAGAGSAASGAGNVAAQGIANAGGNMLTQGAQSAATSAMPEIAVNAAGNTAAQAAAEAAPSFSNGFSTIGNWVAANPAKAIQGVATVGQGINSLSPQSSAPLGPKQANPLSSYGHLSPNYQRLEPLDYTNQYAEGGITQVGEPGMFPQSQQVLHRYATPTNLPAQSLKLQHTINENFDPKTRTYTGNNMAGGGSVQPPVNKFYAAGLAQAQATQAAQAQQPAQAQPPAQVPPQAAMPPQPEQAAPQPGISAVPPAYARGRLISGGGDGVSDSIEAVIDNRQPARLANSEYVIPARAVSELGNGSTEAGAKQLDAMVSRIQQKRAKTVGKGKIAVDAKARKTMPA